MKSFLLLLAGIPVLFCAVSHAAPVPPDQPVHMNLTRKPVFFSHKDHFENLKKQREQAELCGLCHHTVNGEQQFKSCAADGCHDNLDARNKTVHSYYVAVHRPEKKPINSCRSCHKEHAGPYREVQKRLIGCKKSSCHPTE